MSFTLWRAGKTGLRFSSDDSTFYAEDNPSPWPVSIQPAAALDRAVAVEDRVDWVLLCACSSGRALATLNEMTLDKRSVKCWRRCASFSHPRRAEEPASDSRRFESEQC
jgi:hypothetical protein